MGSSYAALDAAFLLARDLSDQDATEALTRINVWMLQEPSKADLLRAVIKPSDLALTAAVVLLDLAEPWELMNSLFKWAEVLRELVFKLLPDLPRAEQEALKEKIKNHVLTYEEPELDDMGNLFKKIPNLDGYRDHEAEGSEEEDEIDLKKDMPLPEGVLKVNFGIPMIVLLNKVDLLHHGDTAIMLKKNLDFITKHLRANCLSYAASLIYVSCSSGTNIDLFYKYLMHRIYGFDFPYKP